MAISSNNSVSPTLLVNKMVSEFSEVIEYIQDPEQKTLCIELLNRFPINNSTCEIYEETALKACARIGDVACGLVRAFLDQKRWNLEDIGTLIHPKSKRRTALHVASENGSVRIAKLLLDYGAKVDCEDADKRTPLHLAAINVQKEMITLLLDHGAKRNSLDMDDQTPMELLSQPMYDAEISTFNTSEYIKEDDLVDVTPKKKRPRSVKVTEEEPVPQPIMQHPNMLYYSGQPFVYPSTNQDQPTQYIYRVVNSTPGFQFAQPSQYVPYGQNGQFQQQYMVSPSMAQNMHYGFSPNQQLLSYTPAHKAPTQQSQKVYALDYSANQQNSMQASELSTPPPVTVIKPLEVIQNTRMPSSWNSPPSTMSKSSTVIPPSSSALTPPQSVSSSPVGNLESQKGLEPSLIQEKIPSVKIPESLNLSPRSLDSPVENEPPSTPVSTRTFVIKRTTKESTLGSLSPTRKYVFKPAEKPEKSYSFKSTNNFEHSIEKNLENAPGDKEIKTEDKAFWDQFGIEGFP